MHDHQQSRQCGVMQTIVAGLALVMFVCAGAIAQPGDKGDKDKAKTVETAKAFAGKFGEGELSIVIELMDGKYMGTITRGGKPFPFTGELKGAQLIGQIEIGGAKSGFTATVEHDELVLTLGLDAQKLSRIVAVPVGGPLKNTIRKEVLLARSDEVQLDSEIASPDNRRVGFIIQRDGLRHAVIDGVEGKAYRRAGAIEFSPDSKRFSYVGEQGAGRLHVVVDELEGETFEALSQNAARFSPDSKRFAYAGMRGKKWRAVIDGQASAPYDEVLYITFSPDSRRVAFAGRQGQAWHVVTDGVEGEAVDAVGQEGILFSPDSRRMAYTIIKGGHHFAVVDGVQGKACEAIAGFSFSPDSRRTYYVALRSGQSVFMVDAEEKGEYDAVRGLSASADGKLTVLGVRKGGKAFHVINDRPDPAFEDVSPPAFSPDSQQIVYAARTNSKWCLIRESKAGSFHDQIPYITFAPDSRRLAYVAMDGEQSRVVIDDVASAKFESIWRNGLYFSPDSRHFTFGARRGGESFLVVDSIEDQSIGSFIPGSQPVFDGNDRFRIITRRGPNYHRLDVRIIRKDR